MTTDYQIVTSIDDNLVQETVKAFLDDGYSLRGDLIVAYDESAGSLVYTQVVVK